MKYIVPLPQVLSHTSPCRAKDKILLVASMEENDGLCGFRSPSNGVVLHARFISVQIRLALLGSCSWSPGIHKFLKKLSCVEYVSIQFSCDLKLPRCLPFLVYTSDSSSFILDSAKSLIDDTTSFDPMLEATSEYEIEYRHALLASIIRHMFHFKRRFAFKKELLALFPNLKNIWAVESTELGTICWEEDIARRTKEKLLKDFCVKLWTAPLVKLPCSGCAINDAILISIQEIEPGHEMNCFEEDEYRELSATMMKEYPCKETSFMSRCVPAPDGWETTCVLDFVLFRLSDG
ncbi:uncharacterized protein LOC142527004 [Primulina tabacum]|uniref:uncharacterized protein LOC142527004 n=1 Tax=Primulina tabacum TaxID=48773 RepID=UPI003F5986B2